MEICFCRPTTDLSWHKAPDISSPGYKAADVLTVYLLLVILNVLSISPVFMLATSVSSKGGCLMNIVRIIGNNRFSFVTEQIAMQSRHGQQMVVSLCKDAYKSYKSWSICSNGKDWSVGVKI